MEGGLEFKPFKWIILVLLFKLTWKLIFEKDKLGIRYVYHKYVKDKDFLQMKNSQGSQAWHDIQAKTKLAKARRCLIIGLGDVLVSMEPWLLTIEVFISELKQ